MFNSRFTQDDFASAWFDAVDAQGKGREFVLSGRDQRFASTSGELRVMRDVKDGKRQHRFIASVRGRDVQSDFGGYALADLGVGQIVVLFGICERVAPLAPAIPSGATDENARISSPRLRLRSCL